jgi:hypothetical protein
MSLNVYLTIEQEQKQAGSGIFIRDNGSTREITRAEWDERFPNREPVIVDWEEESGIVYSANITHNLGGMADAADIYEALWRPEEIGITKASQLIPLLRDGLAKLNTDPARFKTFNPSNGWGNYEGLVRFVADYLAACEAYPDAVVCASR